MSTILIVEDDPQIAGLIKMTLELGGHETLVFGDGTSALQAIAEGGFQLALLDMMLPGVDGVGLLRALNGVPAIFVTAKSDVNDRVMGLRLGAEDYIVKPFEPIELLARVETALRRLEPPAESLAVGDVVLTPGSRSVTKAGAEVPLTPLEYELLLFLMRHLNIAYSREQLLGTIWGYDYFGGTRTVDMHIQKLRSKLGLENRIKTVHKLGYRMEG